MSFRHLTIRDHSAEYNLFLRRIFFIGLFVLIALSLLIVNLFYLQIQSHDTYRTRSNENRIKLVPISPNRGLIYDRHGVLLAENRPSYALTIIPEKTKNLQQTVSNLSEFLGIDTEYQEDFFTEVNRKRRFQASVLQPNLSEEQLAKFAVNQHKFSGVSIEAQLTRYYPHQELFTHALGYVSKINKRDLQQLEEKGTKEHYAASVNIGKLGIEKYYEKELHGHVGYQKVEVNSHGKVIRTLNISPPTPGTDIYLSLDFHLQYVVKQIMGDQRGAILILDPNSGEVLSFYSNPSYDPNLFVHGISRKNFNKLRNSKQKPLINRVTQGQYPPASTIKPLIALLGLEEGTIDENLKIHDPGFYRIPGVRRKYRDWKKWGHGLVDISRAIEQSCDTYFYDLSYRLGIDSISGFMAQFGFGESTGINLYEESRAILPSRGWKRARHNAPWYAGDTISVGIGQGYWTATPLQIGRALAAISTKGKLITPTLLKSTPETVVSKQITIKNERNWQVVIHGMERVVTHGSARLAFKGIEYQSAGKTGTGQVANLAENEEYDADKIAEHLRDNAMYVGFAPIEHPEIVIVVALENVAKGGGGSNAAPMARRLFDYYFARKYS